MSKPKPESKPEAKPKAKPKPKPVRVVGPGVMRGRVRFGVAVAALAASTVLAWADPWARDDNAGVMVSNRSAARRLFPGLGELSPERAVFEFQTPEGAQITLQPAPDGGHVVLAGEQLLGPADPEAIDGIWASLRMATTLRAVSPGADVERGQGGVVRVTVGEQSLVLSLGRAAPDGSGLYGVLEHEGDEAWVVEEELSWLVTQPAEAWLSRRLADLEVERIAGLTWGDQLSLVRGADGNWRSQGEHPALLSTQAVELRLDRLLNLRLDPMLERKAVGTFSPRPWLLVDVEGGPARTFAVGGAGGSGAQGASPAVRGGPGADAGACPEHPDRRLVDRGPGMLGCIEADMLEPWALDDPGAPLIEPRLVPLRYAEVLSVALEAPVRRTLRRRTGGWLLDEGERTIEVIDDEAYRWYAEVGTARIDLGTPPKPREALESMYDRVTLRFETGPETGLRVSCGRDGTARIWCARDGGELRAMAVPPRGLAFDAESFEDRRLLRFAAIDVRSLELEGGDAPRQSIRRDLGTWRLDAPQHPDGDAAVDEVRVSGVLATLAALRGEAWADEAGDEVRELWVDIAPAQGEARRVHVRLLEDCVVQVDDKRPASVSDYACASLTGNLLFDDPLRNWLRNSSTVQVRRPGQTPTVLERRGPGAGSSQGPSQGQDAQGERSRWVDATGAALEAELVAALDDWMSWKTPALREGAPPSPVRWRLDFERAEQALGPVGIDVGDDWVQVRGADWYYRRVQGGSGSGEDDPELEGVMPAPLTPPG